MLSFQAYWQKLLILSSYYPFDHCRNCDGVLFIFLIYVIYAFSISIFS